MNHERKVKFCGAEWDYHNHYSRIRSCKRIKRMTNKKIRVNGFKYTISVL